VQLKNWLEEHYPQLSTHGVQGKHFPAPQWAVLFANAAGMLQMAGFLFMFGGPMLFQGMGIPTPSWAQFVFDNKLMCYGGIYVMNMVAAKFVQTGAFEIYHNDELVFSKRQLQRLPDINEVVQILGRRGLHMEN